jgi:anaerobic carbon-monoxide dehydrogenase iron sulfur subunit
LKLQVKEERCSGCNVCRVVCTLENFGAVQPSQALLKIKGQFPEPGTYKIACCTQCGICAEECPEDAIKESGGEYNIDYDLCTQCLICVDSCPFDVMVVKESGYPAKCTGCGKCVELCPRDAILADQG